MATVNCVSAIDDINTNTTSSKTLEPYISSNSDDDLSDGIQENSLRYAINHASNDSLRKIIYNEFKQQINLDQSYFNKW